MISRVADTLSTLTRRYIIGIMTSVVHEGGGGHRSAADFRDRQSWFGRVRRITQPDISFSAPV